MISATHLCNDLVCTSHTVKPDLGVRSLGAYSEQNGLIEKKVMCCHLKCIPALPPSHITSFLRICSPSALMSPCYPSTFWCNYGVLFVFQGVFRITTKENVEYLLQAANEEEREEWTTAIANAVRRLDIKSKVITSFNGV